MIELMNMHRVIEQWRREGVELLPAGEEAEVIQKLGSLDQMLSRDVVDLYCTTGGMADGGMDEKCWSLWPLERVVEENSLRPLSTLVFADSLINSHFYRLKWESVEASAVYLDYTVGEPERAAGSLDEFFHLYLTDLKKIGL
jgi:hypothetical protein